MPKIRLVYMGGEREMNMKHGGIGDGRMRNGDIKHGGIGDGSMKDGSKEAMKNEK